MYRANTLSVFESLKSNRASRRSALSVTLGWLIQLVVPGVLGGGSRANRAVAVGAMRLAGIVLPGKGWPVRGSFTELVNTPWRSARVGMRVLRVRPRVIRVPS